MRTAGLALLLLCSVLRSDPLPAPDSVSVTAVANDTATLYWSAVDGAHRYEIYNDDVLYEVVRNNIAYLRGLTVGQEYHFAISAINGESGDISAAVTFTATVRPDPEDYHVVHLVTAAGTNATLVIPAPARLFGWYISNRSESYRKVAFHDLADTPTAGTDVYFTLDIPGTGGANVFNHAGIGFQNGIAFTTVTGTADSDDTPVDADDLNINLFYR